jgi:hypothetical protein
MYTHTQRNASVLVKGVIKTQFTEISTALVNNILDGFVDISVLLWGRWFFL